VKYCKECGIGYFTYPEAKECCEDIMPDLHIPTKELVVYHNGKGVMVLNKNLIDSQNCWHMLSVLKTLHSVRLCIEDGMKTESEKDKPDEQVMDVFNEMWESNQFNLQEAWGFPKDSKFHRFWDIPACECPRMDNSDNYPYGHYVTSGGCNIHGLSLRRGSGK